MLNVRVICNARNRERFLVFIVVYCAFVTGYFLYSSTYGWTDFVQHIQRFTATGISVVLMSQHSNSEILSNTEKPKMIHPIVGAALKPAGVVQNLRKVMPSSNQQFTEDSSTKPEVVPKSVVAQIGTVVRFNCTATSEQPVYWTTKPHRLAGRKDTIEIYIGEEKLVGNYGISGRFSVMVNRSSKRYDLVIKDVIHSDGGVYICTDDRGSGKAAFAELAVWDAPLCQEVQGHDSDIEDSISGSAEDVLNFTCIMNFNGNIRPHLEWSIGGRKMNGTQGTESGIASSSLIFEAGNKSDSDNVTCVAAIRELSADDSGVPLTPVTARNKCELWLPKVVPRRVMSRVGTTTRFSCTATNEDPVYWATKSHGSTQPHEIYIGEEKLVGIYATSGRFSVESNNALRRHDLVLRDIKLPDGGVYICTDERGLGKEAYAELIVWDELTCQKDEHEGNYMGENVFGLDQDNISFSCRMSYSGNIRPKFIWSAAGRKFNGTQGAESNIASSLLNIAATRTLDGANVTCEVTLRGHGYGVTWSSDIIHVKYAWIENKEVEECSDIETILNCNPPCSYRLETINGTEFCAVNYTSGSDAKWIYLNKSSAQNTATGNRSLKTGSSNSLYLAGVSCSALIFAAVLGCSIGLIILRLWRKQKRKMMTDTLLEKSGTQNISNPDEQTEEARTDETAAFRPKI